MTEEEAFDCLACIVKTVATSSRLVGTTIQDDAEKVLPFLEKWESDFRIGVPLSPPSSDDKSPTAATGEANSGTQEFKVGYEVKLPDITTGTILSLNTDGTMAVGMLDGTVRYTNAQEVVKL